MLIFQQNPYAQFVASFKAFNDMGYHIRKGQHGMRVLVPVKKTHLSIGNKTVELNKATKQQKAMYHQGKIPGKECLFFKVGTKIYTHAIKSVDFIAANALNNIFNNN